MMQKKILVQCSVIFFLCLIIVSMHPSITQSVLISDFVWSENAGWANFKPMHGGVQVTSSYLSGFVWGENIGWIKLGSGVGPYQNSSSTNWGVNMDSNGYLSGYAWSETGGWINFHPSHSQVRIDLDTGDFEGYAWAENIGWIHFKNAGTPYSVNVGDIKPPAALCKNSTVMLDRTGKATITPQDVDNGSWDNSGIVTLTVAPDTFSTDDLGYNAVTLTVTDPSGNFSACQSMVEVRQLLPDISVIPRTYEYREISMGHTSSEHFIIVNNGNADLLIGMISLTGPNFDQFILKNEYCSNQALPPGGSCSFTIAFSPVSEGVKTASALIPSDDPDEPEITISLRCKGMPVFTFNKSPRYLFIWGSAHLNNTPVPQGGLIGVFAPGVQTNYGCVGAAQLQEDGNYIVTVYGDDPTTPEKDGARNGDVLGFQTWDGNKKEIVSLYPIGPDNPVWGMPNEMLHVNLSTYTKRLIPLSQGWNLISLPVMKCFYDANMPQLPIVNDPHRVEYEEKGSLLTWLLSEPNSPIRDAANINKAGDWQRITSFDEEGAHLLDRDLPECINTLHYISFGYGYWIKMNRAGFFVLQGQPATMDVALNLSQGWNLIGFVPPDICYGSSFNVREEVCPYMTGTYTPEEGIAYCPLDPLLDTVFMSITGKYRRISSFDVCNGAMLYDIDLPSFFNTLHYLGPKYGYMIKMEEEGVLSYPFSCENPI